MVSRKIFTWFDSTILKQSDLIYAMCDGWFERSTPRQLIYSVPMIGKRHFTNQNKIIGKNIDKL